ncbi:D-alanyl-D-alanine carboxypeptidase [Cronobacter muytjensii 530]
MKTTFSVRFMQRLAVSATLSVAALSTAAHADDLNIKTMIPGVPQIDAEAYILIDYNSGKVLAEQNADARARSGEPDENDDQLRHRPGDESRQI